MILGLQNQQSAEMFRTKTCSPAGKDKKTGHLADIEADTDAPLFPLKPCLQRVRRGRDDCVILHLVYRRAPANADPQGHVGKRFFRNLVCETSYSCN
ncbi:MAG TPA: hypothetical protein VL202_05075 [Pararhizobium sp.]|uniref:hypothetical protein n=1 Tax=Pararhizobium sp. TaxID=1977563 RepID=UPI002BD882B2|nr:hypothetical protein [Pararhizobium sp.]HTO30537.1 hypothetical protein [Pararhizobium sp.]